MSEYRRFLEDHGLSAPPATREQKLAQIETLEQLAERKERNAKHAPSDFDRRRALDRADHYDELADQLRQELAQPSDPCPGECGFPAQTYDGDPCPYCTRNRQRTEGR